ATCPASSCVASDAPEESAHPINAGPEFPRESIQRSRPFDRAGHQEEDLLMKHRRVMSAMLPGILCAFSLAAFAAPPSDTVKARQKFFGIENVDENGNVKGD